MSLLFYSNKKKFSFVVDEQKETIAHRENENGVTSISNSPDLLEEVSAQLGKIHKIALSQPQVREKNIPDPIEGLMTDLFPILDSMERILDLARTFEDNEILKNWIKNVEAVYRKLRSVLIRQGLREIETTGTKVDYNLHEVVEYQETTDIAENTIIGVKQKGYYFRNKVLRDAKVVVVKPAVKS
jgi:molecular chaperone GrpE